MKKLQRMSENPIVENPSHGIFSLLGSESVARSVEDPRIRLDVRERVITVPDHIQKHIFLHLVQNGIWDNPVFFQFLEDGRTHDYVLKSNFREKIFVISEIQSWRGILKTNPLKGDFVVETNVKK